MVETNLRLIESFLVRRSFAGFEPTGLHSVFKDLWAETQGEPKKFVSAIAQRATVQFPDDQAFANDVKTKPLYGRRLAPYVVRQYELSLRGGDPLPSDVSLTLDHIIPQELSAEWKLVIGEADHQKVLHTWANLVPLSGPANSEKGQRTWSSAREFFLTETMYKTTKRLAHEYELWNPESISARAEHLSAWALERWPKDVLKGE